MQKCPAEIYLDNNANTAVVDCARQAILEAIELLPGNPSSPHEAGDRARQVIQRSREALANLTGTDPDQVYFTSGATEANNTILFNAFRESPTSCRIVTSTVEHRSVLATCHELERRGATVVYVPVLDGGLIDVEKLNAAIRSGTSLVSIQWVNHETGVIQPIEQIGNICRRAGVRFHTDAAQAVGKISMRLGDLPVDFLSLSAQKFNGPVGVGGLYSKRPACFHPLIYGGGQERGMRSGTENLIGIAGLGAAAEYHNLHLDHTVAIFRSLRDAFEERVLAAIPEACVNGNVGHRVCNTSSLRFVGLDGGALVARLNQEGVRSSQSSACTSQRPEPSYVLRAMGLSEDEAYSSVRFSFGLGNDLEQVHRAVQAVSGVCESLRNFARLRVPASIE